MSEPGPVSVVGPQTIRRFNIGDALVLIAALALSLSVLSSTPWFARILPRMRFWWEASGWLMGVSPWPPTVFSRSELINRLAVTMISEFSQLLAALLVGATLAAPLLRLRRPRPVSPDIIRQPGLVACIAVVIAAVLVVDVSWIFSIRISPLAILAIALVLVWPLAGLPPWHSEPSWVDRLGRAVGWGWIVLTACVAAINVLS